MSLDQQPQDVSHTEKRGEATESKPSPTPAAEEMIPKAKVEEMIRARLEADDRRRDYAALMDKAKKWDSHEESQKSAEQKLQEQLTALQQQTEKAKADRRDAVLRSAIVAAAAKAGMADPADAYSLLDKSKIEIKDDDTVTGIEEAIKALAEAKPYLLKSGRQTTATSATNPAGNAGVDNLDWHPLRRKRGSQIGGGGVRYNEEA